VAFSSSNTRKLEATEVLIYCKSSGLWHIEPLDVRLKCS
jgi:hypothetical protein